MSIEKKLFLVQVLLFYQQMHDMSTVLSLMFTLKRLNFKGKTLYDNCCLSMLRDIFVVRISKPFKENSFVV